MHRTQDIMTRDEILQIARAVAAKEGWLWREPFEVKQYRRFFFFGRRRWCVTTNCMSSGCNIHVGIDAETGKVISKGYAPR